MRFLAFLILAPLSLVAQVLAVGAVFLIALWPLWLGLYLCR